MSALELTDVVVDYARRGGGRVRAVAGASISVERGQIVGLVGESGCGKSTLARAAVGLVRPTSGSVVFEGREIVPLGRRGRPRELARLQLVFQNPYASLNPRRKVGSQLADALDTLDLVPAAGRAARVQELLEVVGLPATAAERFPHEFSGGQRQRIAIARTLAADPSVIVLDEPLASLDASAQAQLANLLVSLSRELGLGLLLISHDLAIVRHVADAVSVMYLGRMVETGPTGPALGAAAPPLQRVADQRDPAPGRERLPARRASRRGSRSGTAAERLPLPSPLPVRVRALQRRGAAARGARRRPLGGLLAAARGLDRRLSRRARPTCRRCRRPIASYACVLDPSPDRGAWAVKRLRSSRAALYRVARGGARGRIGARRRTAPRARTASATLVVDNSFTIKTSDPGRAFDPTASLVDHAIYDTLFTYKGGDLAHPIPLLVSSFKASANAKTYTFQLKRNVHFADGTPLTSADVAFSLRRLQNLKGNPSFLLAGYHGLGAVEVHGRHPLEDAGHPAAGDPREPVDRRPQLGAREEERRHRRRQRGQGRQGRELAQLHPLGRRRQRPVHAERLQHDLADHADAERELLGREEVRPGRAWSSATWSPRRSCSTSAAARTRSRSTCPPTRRRR